MTSPILFNIYSTDQPTHPDAQTVEYATDKVSYSTHSDPVTVSTYNILLKLFGYTKFNSGALPKNLTLKKYKISNQKNYY